MPNTLNTPILNTALLRILGACAWLVLLHGTYNTPVFGDSVEPDPEINRTRYLSANLPGHPHHARGRVLDITFGRVTGATELHEIWWARPRFDYAVVGQVFFQTPCLDGAEQPVEVPEGTLSTNRRGNGRFAMHFPGAVFDGAPSLFFVRWTLRADNRIAYVSGCTKVTLDE